MATTTINAIRTAIETLIKGLTPAAKHFRHPTYRVGSHVEPFEKRAAGDIDREFEVEDIKAGRPVVFGATSELDFTGTMIVKVGHAITGNRHEGMDRRDTDLHQIAWAIEKTSNLPSGVAMIRRNGWTINELPEFWITTLTFEVVFFMAY
jgi:hypothetical protein